MWKRNLTLTMSFTDAYAKLEKLAGVSSNFPKSLNTKSRDFVLYRSCAYRQMRNIYTFRFNCTLSTDNETVFLSYQVRPLLPACFVALFLGVSLLSGFFNFLFGNGSWPFLMISFLINLVFGVLVHSQARECMRLFEHEFQAQKTGDGTLS